ncbi:hypothetical protein F66182_17320, partial [Fusarium sp. NRRL 66182]
MSTVIIGGGIIGASIAHYLSNPSSSSNAQQDYKIHVIESSGHLFSGASGYAAGFIAKDWFAPALAPLGKLSDPLRLCHFLHETTTSQGVQWHHPAHVVSVTTDPTTKIIRSVTVLNSENQTEYTIACRNLVICAGPWTSRVYKTLFPSASATDRPHISSLAGYSLLVRSPRHSLLHEHDQYKGKSHAVFTTLPEDDGGFSPEIFSREGAEIYIAGLNSTEIPLPTRAEGAKAIMDKQQIAKLRKVAVQFLGKLAENEETVNEDDLEVLREGLCFRPVSNTGLPIVSR